MSSPPLARPTVLVVDDEQGVLTLLELSLQHVGYNVICAQSGREAMEILESERGATIDLTILDYSMPGFDGIEVGLPDGPKADEIVYGLAMSCGGRVHSRMGGLEAWDVKGEDGLR